MYIDNLLKINDWEIKKFFILVFALQLATFGVIGAGLAGLNIPVLRPLICFLYLMFVPGYLILRALKVHNLETVDTVLYAIGSSLATLMLAGVLLNVFGPVFHVEKPLSVLPVTITLGMLVLALSLVCYIRDRGFFNQHRVDVRHLFSPPALLLGSILCLVVIATYAMDVYDNNALLFLLLIALAVIVLLVGFDRFIPGRLYPFAIFTVSLALLFHSSLISPYVTGWDIQQEVYLSNSVIANGYWNLNFNHVINSMLSVVMIAPIFSMMTGLDVVWVFKIIYPFILALVPLGLYQLSRKQSGEKIAFLSAFFFSTLVVFYTELIALARQEIAELFVVLILLLLINRSMEKSRWSVLFLAFTFSLILSHYGLTYIFMGSLILIWAFLQVIRKAPVGPLKNIQVNRMLTVYLISSLVAFCIVWYANTSLSNPFETLVFIVDRIARTIMDDFLNPDASQGLAMISSGGTPTLLHRLYFYMLLFTQACIVLGIVTAHLNRDIARFKSEYYAFALVSMALLIMGIALPFFASAINTTRLYQIALIVLAPFFVIGWVSGFRLLKRVVRRKDIAGGVGTSLKLLSVFLAIYLMFNSGVLFEITKDAPMSLSLNRSIDSYTFNANEVAGARWLFAERNLTVTTGPSPEPVQQVYADHYRSLLLTGWDIKNDPPVLNDSTDIPADSYLYLGTYNVMKGKLDVYVPSGGGTQEFWDLGEITMDRQKIYTNGGAEVFI